MLQLIRAREASPAGALVNLSKTLAQAAVFWTVFFGVLPSLLCRIESSFGLWTLRLPHAEFIGCALFVLAGGLGVTSAVYMAIIGQGTPLPLDCARVLVIRGPYRYVRNPMAIAGLTQGFAVGLAWGSWLTILYVAFGCALWNQLVRKWEEADLELRFGQQFRAYRQHVRCWIPRLTPY